MIQLEKGKPMSDSFPEVINAYARYIYEWSKSKGFWHGIGYIVEEPHFVGGEDCMGGPVAYWRCWAKLYDSGKYVCGVGASAEQARKDADERAKGSDQFAEKVALTHSELSEMLETHRQNPDRPDDHCPEFYNLEIEAADVIIRVLDMAAAYKWRIGEAIEAKMKVNEQRPHKHGKNY